MTADRENIAAGTDEDELNTTAPQSEADVWRMPEPVFRRTSGKLPQGLVRDDVEAEVASGEPVVDGEPVLDTVTPVEPKNPTLKIILVLLGVVAMVAFLIVFLSVLYFFFFQGD